MIIGQNTSEKYPSAASSAAHLQANRDQPCYWVFAGAAVKVDGISGLARSLQAAGQSLDAHPVRSSCQLFCGSMQ